MAPKHFSAAQLLMFESCGEAYRRRYEEGESIPPGFTQIRGTGVHKGREVNFKQKLTSGIDIPLEDVKDAVRDQVNSSFAGEVLLEEEYAGRPLSGIKGECIDVCTDLASVDYDVFQKPTQPTMVEEKLSVNIESIGDVIGYIDLKDSNHWIRDLKTKTKTPPKDFADNDEKMTVYHLLALMNKVKVAGLQLECLVKLKTSVKTAVFKTERDINDVQALLNRFKVSIDCINAGMFVPTSTGSWKCNPKWCGYWGTCPYVIGRTRYFVKKEADNGEE